MNSPGVRSLVAREDRRFALLTIAGEVERMIDTSEEWDRHPETHEKLSMAQIKRMKTIVLDYVRRWERAAEKLR